MQEYIFPNGRYTEFEDWLERNHCKKVMIVSGHSMMEKLHFRFYLDAIKRAGAKIIGFHDFSPNPTYESVVKGVNLFRAQKCDAVIAVGGGSTIDVGKCIKLYANMLGSGENGSYLKQNISPSGIPLLAVPTTAGSGSEATRYAVIYYNDQKQSITSESCIPNTVLFDVAFLRTLPEYQKKATMCDALCHAIESYWSINSTLESKEYSEEAIHGVLESMDGYLNNTDSGNAGMLRAAYLAGKAINISQTTAGHAMCYLITSKFGCAHGHASMLCNRVLFPWMIKNTDKCVDPRGSDYLAQILNELGRIMGCSDAESGSKKLEEIFVSLKIEIPMATEEQIEELKKGVNPIRLKNHPIALDEKTIDMLYRKILN